jgi:hypothetical protein
MSTPQVPSSRRFAQAIGAERELPPGEYLPAEVSVLLIQAAAAELATHEAKAREARELLRARVRHLWDEDNPNRMGYEAIGQRVGRHPSTIREWMQGRRDQRAARREAARETTT